MRSLVYLRNASAPVTTPSGECCRTRHRHDGQFFDPSFEGRGAHELGDEKRQKLWG
jgi:hypothetical protein